MALRIEEDAPLSPELPAAPLRTWLRRVMFEVGGREALEQRFALRHHCHTRTAARRIREALDERAATVDLFVADELAIAVGSHVDIIFPEAVTA